MKELYFTVKEVATLLKRSERAVRHLIYRGYLPAYRIGRVIYVKASDLEQAFKPVKKEGEN
jgi:excisionase family DNA binding protein